MTDATQRLIEAVQDVLPKVGQPDNVWCMLHASTLQEIVAALAAAQQEAAQGVQESIQDKLDATRYRWLRDCMLPELFLNLDLALDQSMEVAAAPQPPKETQ